MIPVGLIGAALLQTTAPQINDFGATYKTVYYRSGTTRPTPGFEIDLLKFQNTMQGYLVDGVTNAQIAMLFDKNNLLKSKKHWSISKKTNDGEEDGNQSLTSASQSNTQVNVTIEKGVMRVIPWQAQNSRDSDGLLDPWGYYKLEFNIKEYVKEVLGDANLARRESVRQGPGLEVENPDPDPHLRRSGFASVDLKSSLAPSDTKLISGKWGVNEDTGEPEFKKRGAQGAVLEVTYKDTMFRLPTGNKVHRVGSFTIDGVISTYPIDNRSLIDVRSGGVTSTSFGSTVATSYIGLRTSQSLSRTDIFLEQAWRFGDPRGGRRDDVKPTFIPEEDCNGMATFDIGLEFGGTIVKPLLYVDLRDNPTGPPIPKIFVRPFARLNLFKGSLLGGNLAVSGKVQAWYLHDKVGGVLSSTRLAERAELEFLHENGNLTFTFGITAGRNPASSFVKIVPSYTMGLSMKF